MKRWSMCAGLLGLIGMSSSAFADLAGGPVFAGGGRQGQVRCMVFNAGPGTATITSHSITTGGSPVPLSFDSCGTTLASRRLCVLAAAPVEQVAHACRVVATGGALRGTIAVYSDSDAMLHSSDLR
jgi:hypothetical protein